MKSGSSRVARRGLGLALVSVLFIPSGCLQRESLPPVFGAVFGVTGAEVTPFAQGRIPETKVAPNSRLVGAAAANPGSCIWQDTAGRRFRAACPEGSDGLAPKS